MISTMKTQKNEQTMQGRELKELRLLHLTKRQKELEAKLSSLHLSDEKYEAVAGRHEQVTARLATIQAKLAGKGDKCGETSMAPYEKQELKTKRIARSKACLERGGALKRVVHLRGKLEHVRTVLATPDLPSQRKCHLEAKEQRLKERLSALLGEQTVADATDATVIEPTHTKDERVGKGSHLQAKLEHVKSVLARPSLPAERRARLETKEKMLTARLEEMTGVGLGSDGGEFRGKGFGKGFGPHRHGKGMHGKGVHGKGGHGKGKGGLGMSGKGEHAKGRGKGNRMHTKGMGAAEASTN